MSKLVKGIGKVFKKAGKIVKKVVRKAGKFLKKYGKWIALAVAVYFTAGAALSYFGVATLPGFAVAGVGGATSTGIFAKVAGHLGMKVVAAGGKAAFAASTVGVGIASGAGILTPGAQAAFLAGGTAAPTAAMMPGMTSSITGLALGSGGAVVGGGGTVATGWWAGLDSMGKMLVLKTATEFAGNLMTKPPETEKDKVEARNINALGIGREGTGPGAVGGFNAAFGDLTQGQGQFVSAPQNTPPGQTPSGQYNIPQFQNQNLDLMAGNNQFLGAA